MWYIIALGFVVGAVWWWLTKKKMPASPDATAQRGGGQSDE